MGAEEGATLWAWMENEESREERVVRRKMDLKNSIVVSSLSVSLWVGWGRGWGR